MNYTIVVQFQHGPVKNEGQGGDQMRPHPRQQHAGDNNNQGIKEVERTVPSSSFVDDKTNQNQIGQNLQRGLQPVLLPQGEQKHVEQGKTVPENYSRNEQPHGQRRRSELCDRQ